MTRDDRGEFVDLFAEEQFWEGIFEPLYATMPQTVFAMLVGGIAVLSLYSWTESITLPAIVLALFGGILITLLPPAAAIIATIAVAAVLAVVLAAIYGGG